MDQKKLDQQNTYCIRVKEVLDHLIADWSNDIRILPGEDGETILVGQFPDQPALRGFLNQLWNLNFTILSVESTQDGKPKEQRTQQEK